MDEIVQKENPVLRKVAKEVTLSDIPSKEIQDIIKRMKESLATQKDGVALAAPQIGVQLRIFIVSHKVLGTEDSPAGDDKVFINPVITKTSRRMEAMDEGCLSVRWKYGTVKRAKNASVKAYDENGELFTYNGTGLMSQIFQHETDHLEGVLFTDKATDLHDIDPEEIDYGEEL